MKHSILLVILIGIVMFTTLIALVGGGIAHSSLYNKIWLANGNEPPECMTPNDNIFTCPHTDAEYYHGFYWSSHITQFSILIAGIVLGVKLCNKRTEIPKKPLIIIAIIIVFVVVLVFTLGYLRTQSYYEGAYRFVMFDCFDERAPVPTLHAKIIYQNDTHIIDNKNCEWQIRK